MKTARRSHCRRAIRGYDSRCGVARASARPQRRRRGHDLAVAHRVLRRRKHLHRFAGRKRATRGDRRRPPVDLERCACVLAGRHRDRVHSRLRHLDRELRRERRAPAGRRRRTANTAGRRSPATSRWARRASCGRRTAGTSPTSWGASAAPACRTSGSCVWTAAIGRSYRGAVACGSRRSGWTTTASRSSPPGRYSCSTLQAWQSRRLASSTKPSSLASLP